MDSLNSTSAYIVNATTLGTETSLKTDTCLFLKFQFFRNNDNKLVPTTGFQKFLSADSHITVVKEDLSEIHHLHGFGISEDMMSMPCGEHSAASTSIVTSMIGLPISYSTHGKYRIFLQSKIDGMMLAPSFPVTIVANTVKSVSIRNVLETITVLPVVVTLWLL
jgi:uncharacterized membrane protein